MKPITKSPKKAVLMDDHLPGAVIASDILKPKKLNQTQYQSFIDLKNDRSERELNLRSMLFTLSLCLSLILVIVAINWRFYENTNQVDLGMVEDNFETLTEIPISHQPPPPPPKLKVENLQIVEVENDEVIEELEVNLDVEITQEESLEDIVYDDIPMEAEEEEVEEIFQIVENQPVPEGGMSTFYTFIAENLKYPAMARRLNLTGIVFVRFVVEKDGKITDAQVIKGIGGGCDEEAVRVVAAAPPWIPGKQRGRPVRVYMTVPIRFILFEG